MPLATMSVVIIAFLSTAAASAESLYACANTKKGTLRLVASPADCNAKKVWPPR